MDTAFIFTAIVDYLWLLRMRNYFCKSYVLIFVFKLFNVFSCLKAEGIPTLTLFVDTTCQITSIRS